MKVLIACECSGIVRDAFAAKGHDAWSCDLQPTERTGQHIEGDIMRIGSLFEHWDLIIAHPPCTRLSNSGVRWLHERNLWNELDESIAFFNLLMHMPTEKICLENPIQHKYARAKIRKYDQLIQPWQFGHTVSKATCLWLKGVPKLLPTDIVAKELRTHDIHLMSPGPDRQKNRSRTFEGIAKAMAEQWG